jgi:hypothetical protein
MEFVMHYETFLETVRDRNRFLSENGLTDNIGLALPSGTSKAVLTSHKAPETIGLTADQNREVRQSKNWAKYEGLTPFAFIPKAVLSPIGTAIMHCRIPEQSAMILERYLLTGEVIRPSETRGTNLGLRRSKSTKSNIAARYRDAK